MKADPHAAGSLGSDDSSLLPPISALLEGPPAKKSHKLNHAKMPLIQYSDKDVDSDGLGMDFLTASKDLRSAE